MVQTLVSVVVPVYKVEKYLDRCIESIVNQTYRNLEIILVDDGSPDNCPQMCDEWSSKDNRIKVIHKENQGAGIARNAGINIAQGEYICFIDSDDYADKSLIEKAYKTIKENAAEVVVFGHTSFDELNGKLKSYIPESPNKCFEGEDVKKTFLPNLIENTCDSAQLRNISLSLWSCFISLELIKKIGWQLVSERELLSEDSYSLIELYSKVNKVVILPESLYFYFQTPNSLSNTFRKDSIFQLEQFYFRTILLVSGLEYVEKIKNRIAGLGFSLMIGMLKTLVASKEHFKIKIKTIKAFLNNKEINKMLLSADSKYKSNAKTILYKIMKHKLVFAVYFLVKFQVARDKRQKI